MKKWGVTVKEMHSQIQSHMETGTVKCCSYKQDYSFQIIILHLLTLLLVHLNCGSLEQELDRNVTIL